MIAFIYAAGRAMRLGPEFADQQKILIEFGGKSLLEWHAKRLSEVGINKMVVITGFTREKIVNIFPELKIRYGMESVDVYNKNYTEGSVLSFHVSMTEIINAGEPVILMDGDVLYPAEILRRLVHSKHRTALLIDRNFTSEDDDPVLVPVLNGIPLEFLKRWQGTAEIIGESIGFFKIDPAEIPILEKETLKRTVGERRKESYDEIIRALVISGYFGYEDVTGIPWTEIDFPQDVEFARKVIFPSILRYERNQK